MCMTIYVSEHKIDMQNAKNVSNIQLYIHIAISLAMFSVQNGLLFGKINVLKIPID